MARVRADIIKGRLLRSRARVIIGVSGGPDSVALLHLLTALSRELSLTLFILHVDHGLRPESPDEARFVEQLAAKLRWPVTIVRRPVRTIARANGWSLEDGARRVRYQAFLEAARRHTADAVAVGHTANDQAETVLMRLLRGTGVGGLGGIPVRRTLEASIWLVRPLLHIWRDELIEYLDQKRQPYRHDPSNEDRTFVRNRIRHELLPHLAGHYNPNISMALVQLAQQSGEDSAYLQAAASRQWKRIVKTPRSGEVLISIPKWLRQPRALQWQLIRQLVIHLRGEWNAFEARHFAEVERLMRERPVATVLDLPGRIQLVKERELIRCSLVSSR